jgi:hypothetical protein
MVGKVEILVVLLLLLGVLVVVGELTEMLVVEVEVEDILVVEVVEKILPIPLLVVGEVIRKVLFR